MAVSAEIPERASNLAAVGPESGPAAAAGRRSWLWWLALAVLAGLLAGIAWQSVKRPPSFDGAMNLQVAWSLAQGEGYRRTYAGREPFPREVQTNAPYILPAAAVYAVAGMGMAQSQLVNLFYLLGLVLVCHGLVRRHAGPVPAMLGAVVVLVTPGLFLFGLRGYGEVPALFWALLALYAFGDGRRRSGLVLAGLCLGLAMATKTVMAMTCAIFAAGFALTLLARPGLGRWQRCQQVGLLAAATIAPQLLVEVWRLFALGGAGAWLGWWQVELAAIGKQAGVTSGYQDTAGLGNKIGRHLQLLAPMYGLPVALLVAWMAGPLLLAAALVFRRKRPWRYHDGLVLMIILAALAYFVWWLVLTPTQKAWHRRILDGSLLLNLAWVMVATWWWRALAPPADAPAGCRRGLAGLPALALAALAVNFLITDLAGKLRHSPGYKGFHSLVAAVRALPEQALVAGVAWYSAPTLSLLAQRPLVDFNDLVVPALDPDEPVYLIRDQVTPHGHVARILDTYGHDTVADAGRSGSIHRVDIGTANPDLVRAPARSSLLVMSTQLDDPMAGFYQGERDGRWMSSNAYVRLLHPAGSVLAVDLFLPPLRRYRPADDVRLQVQVEDCDLGSHRFTAGGVHTLRFAIPERCGLADGQPVLVRLAGSALMKGSITRDGRALFAKMQRLGFVPDDALPASPGEAEGARPAMDAEPVPGSAAAGAAVKAQQSREAVQAD